MGNSVAKEVYVYESDTIEGRDKEESENNKRERHISKFMFMNAQRRYKELGELPPLSNEMARMMKDTYVNFFTKEMPRGWGEYVADTISIINPLAGDRYDEVFFTIPNITGHSVWDRVVDKEIEMFLLGGYVEE